MNKKIMGGIIIILFIGVLIGAFGQLLIKMGTTQMGEIRINDTKLFIPTIFKIITNKFIFCGLLLSAIAALFWITVLSRSNLSFIYPLGTALLCIILLIFSALFLKEKITLGQIIGVITIIFGIIILSKY